jgi:hypothetical protein
MSCSEDKLVRLPLDAKTHTRFRLIAAARGKPMSQVARAIVEGYVAEREAEAEVKRGTPARRPRK